MKYPIIFLALTLCVVACEPTKKNNEEAHLGDLEHNFSISDAARTSFDEGLLLLHSFEY